jgi:hypothetical protein
VRHASAGNPAALPGHPVRSRQALTACLPAASQAGGSADLVVLRQDVCEGAAYQLGMLMPVAEHGACRAVAAVAWVHRTPMQQQRDS